MNFGRVKPTFIISGVQKGATSALHSYLIQHPQLVAPKTKELHYFDNLTLAPENSYHQNFPRLFFSNKISFESTPRYLYYPNCAQRIAQYNPKMKFIVLLRNPVKRAYSAWNMYRQMIKEESKISYFKKLERDNPAERLYSILYKSNEFPSFKECIDMEMDSAFMTKNIEPSILRRGYYTKQIESYLEYFGRDQFLFINSYELKKNTIQVLNRISEFLRIKDFNNLDLNLEPRHERAYIEPISEIYYSFLLSHYQEQNKGLEALVDMSIEWMKPIN